MGKDTIVIGLGNPLMSDEGIGVYLVERLSAFSARYPAVDFADGGTGGVSLLHLLEGRRRAVIIDCAQMGAEPGRISRFSPDQVESVKHLSYRSLHEGDVLRIIDMARRLGQCPEEIVIFGIQPGSVAFGGQLTDKLAAKVDEYLALICAELGPPVAG